MGYPFLPPNPPHIVIRLSPEIRKSIRRNPSRSILITSSSFPKNRNPRPCGVKRIPP